MRACKFPESIHARRVSSQYGEELMVPDTKEWRQPSTYDFMDEVGTDDLAWECLRRNAKYQKDFSKSLATADTDEQQAEVIQNRWGLRFPRPPQPQWPRTISILDA